MYRQEVDVPLEKISDFKKLVLFLQIDVYFYEELEDDVEVKSHSKIVSDVNISMDLDFYSSNGSLDISTEQSLSSSLPYENSLSPLETSRRWRNHREYRPRKSLVVYNGPWRCWFCPNSPFFNSKHEKTQHEMYCSFNNTKDFYVCDSCGKKFVLKKSIYNHIRKHI